MNTNHTDSVEALVDEFEKTFVDFVGDIEFAEAFAHLADDPSAPFVLPEMCNWLRKTLTPFQATQSQQVEEAVRKEREGHLNDLIRITERIIRKEVMVEEYLVRWKEMLQALTPHHQD